MHIIDVVTHDLRDIDQNHFYCRYLKLPSKVTYYYFFSWPINAMCAFFSLLVSRIVLTRNREIFFKGFQFTLSSRSIIAKNKGEEVDVEASSQLFSHLFN